jgi:ubiquinone/menaquinone biosynthesis C-methylase UbiE
MTKLNKEKVYEVYDEIIRWFDEARTKTLMEKEYLDLIVNTVPKNSSILDLGCGSGEPIAKFFIEKGYQLTGVDGSANMISLCKKRFPQARWLVADMSELQLDEKFDVILAWHSFFHLTYEHQRKMFSFFKSHIKPNGVLAFTSGIEYGEVWGNNGGHELYHASLSTEEYRKLLAENNFNVLVHKEADPNCGEATVWVAQSA